jgi:hypothetical protein
MALMMLSALVLEMVLLMVKKWLDSKLDLGLTPLMDS